MSEEGIQLQGRLCRFELGGGEKSNIYYFSKNLENKRH